MKAIAGIRKIISLLELNLESDNATDRPSQLVQISHEYLTTYKRSECTINFDVSKGHEGKLIPCSSSQEIK